VRGGKVFEANELIEYAPEGYVPVLTPELRAQILATLPAPEPLTVPSLELALTGRNADLSLFGFGATAAGITLVILLRRKPNRV
jgi:hypothetical protein